VEKETVTIKYTFHISDFVEISGYYLNPQKNSITTTTTIITITTTTHITIQKQYLTTKLWTLKMLLT